MRKIIFYTFVILILGSAGYIYWYYFNAFGDGGREGVLQKFSRKGNVFKTYEGEIVMLGFGTRNGNFNANYFYFSVSDQAVADSLEKVIGKNVKVHYMQYRRHLPWRGENYSGKNSESGQYIVDRIIEVSEPKD